MEVRQYFSILRKHWLAIVVVCAVTGGYSFYTGLQQKPLYRASTTIAISPSAPNPLLGNGYGAAATAAQDLVPSYIEFMRGDAFVAAVAKALDLPDVTDDTVRGAISAEGIPNTVLFRINAVSTRADYAQLFANTVARVFIEQNIQQQQEQQRQSEASSLNNQTFEELRAPLVEENKYYSTLIDSIRRQITELDALPPSADRDGRLQDLRSELLQTEDLRIRVLSGLADLKAKAASVAGRDLNTIIVVNQARLPSAPLSSNTMRNVLTAIVAAFVLSLAGAVLWEQLDYTFKTPEEVDAQYGMPTLAVIGVLDSRGGIRNDRERLVSLRHPRSSAAEAFRSLRTSIQLAGTATPIKSLLVTSAGPGEGKSLTAANLAVAIAQTGQSVLLVDLDLRRPAQHRYFGLENKAGFTNLLMDEHKMLADVAHASEVEGLRVLTTGPLPPNPAELLGSARSAALVARLRDEADWVIYDSPPAVTVTDSVILAPQVDAVIQIIMAGTTRRNVVLGGRDVLMRTQCRLIGPVINRVKMGDLGYYYYYYTRYYGTRTPRMPEPAPVGRWLRSSKNGKRGHDGEHEPDTAEAPADHPSS